MQNSIPINLIRAPSHEEFTQLTEFHGAFVELLANWQDLRANGFELAFGSELRNDGKVHSDKMNITRFRLKGFLVDYRVLTQQKEHICALRIQNLVRNITKNSRVSAILDRHKLGWNGIGSIAGWHNDFSGDDVLNAFFNEQLFHKKQSGKSTLMLSEVRSKMSEDSIWWEVMVGAFTRFGLISELDWMLHPVLNGNSHVQIAAQ